MVTVNPGGKIKKISFIIFHRATKVFQQVLYLDPGFSCSNEVHLRLGIIYKAQNNYEASIKVNTPTE